MKNVQHVIIRDDDTNALTPVRCLERLYRPFLERGLPVSLAVIPEVRADVRMPDGRKEEFLMSGHMEPKGPVLPIGDNAELCGYLRSEPGFHVIQHGCNHDYFEFDRLGGVEAGKRLDRGLAQLEEAGLGRPRSFVAPYDRVSRGTFGEVARRFDVLSTGWFELRRIPPSWWARYLFAKRVLGRRHWKAGNLTLLSHPGCLLSCHHPRSGMLERVRAAVDGGRLTVLVTHWWEYFRDGKEDTEFVEVLHGVARYLANRSDLRVITPAELASGQVPLP